MKMTEQAIQQLDQEIFGITKLTKPMKKAIEQIAEANALVDDQYPKLSAMHFDGENFPGGQAFVLANRKLVISALKQDNAGSARFYLGQALHALQDFYSHSNWIELGNGSPQGQLGVVGAAIGNGAPADQRTCVECGTIIPGLLCPDCSSNLTTSLLTSGYYGGQDRVKPSNIKCSHGGVLDSSAVGIYYGQGINKDVRLCDFSPHNALHDTAVGVAREATKKFIRELRNDLTEAEFKLLLGIGPTLGMAIDTTGSMGSVIAQVKATAVGIVDSRIDTDEEPSKYVLVPFNDPSVGPTTATTDPAQFKAAINSLFAYDGGDCPELSMTGMLRAVAASEERGTVFMFTDASSADGGLAGAVASLSSQKNIKVFPMTFGSCSPIDPGYFQIAEDSGGQLFELLRSEAGKVTQLADFLVRSNAVDVLSVARPVSGTITDTVPVDTTLEAVTFSISGTPSVVLRRPDGSTVGAADPGVSFVSLTKGAIYRIAAPAPGSWTVEATASGSYSLLVSGESDLDLDAFRFVEDGGRPDHEGLFRIPGLPTDGEPGTVVAVMSGVFGDPAFTLRTKDGSTLATLPLTRRVGDQDNELSGVVTLPDDRFLVYANGLDANGMPYQRLVASMIEPQSVKIGRVTPKPLPVGTTTTYTFKVTNTGPEGDFQLTGSDDQAFLQSVSPSFFHLASGQAADVDVSLAVPLSALDGTPDTLTVNVESVSGTARNSAVVVSTVVAEGGDTTPPAIQGLTADPALLWPPNHQMVDVTLSLTVVDDQDPAPVCQISGVNSNEPIDGPGDGSTVQDWEIPNLELLELRLRAERSGTGSDRVYMVGVTCSDASGNSNSATVAVTVPHNR